MRCELVKTADIVAALTDAASWQRAVVVMTGDVGLFSGARRLVEALSGDAQVDVRVIPGISSASYLAARLARPWPGLALRERSRRGVRHRGRGRARR